MFQCIIQQRNGWIHTPNPETRDVFPGKLPFFLATVIVVIYSKWSFYDVELLFIGLFIINYCLLLNWAIFSNIYDRPIRGKWRFVSANLDFI